MAITPNQVNAYWTLFYEMVLQKESYIELPKGRAWNGERWEDQPIGDGVLKSLEEYGLITVVTISERAWKYSGTDKNYYRIGLGPKAVDWMQGKIEVEKPCNLRIGDASYGYHYDGVCPRHNKRHGKDEYDG